MVVRRFLVPFVLVRIQVGQLKKRLETMFRAFFGYIGILLMVSSKNIGTSLHPAIPRPLVFDFSSKSFVSYSLDLNSERIPKRSNNQLTFIRVSFETYSGKA